MDISEQVKELRELADDMEKYVGLRPKPSILRESADTIESLSAKLQAANTERSAEDCGGWITRNMRLPKEDGKYWISYSWGSKEYVDISNFREGKFEFEVSVKTVIDAWKPCISPEPYHEP